MNTPRDSSGSDSTEILRFISHEFEAPLRHLEFFLDQLTKNQKDKLDEKGQQHLEFSRKAANQLNLLFEGAQKISKIRDLPAPQPCDLEKHLHQAYKEIQKKIPENQSVLQAQFNENLLIPHPLFSKAFEEIFANSILFNDQTKKTLEVSAHSENGQTQISIRDYGPGLPEGADASLAFAPFRQWQGTRTTPGPGVGLTIAKKIIEHFEGQIQIQLAPNSGLIVQISYRTPS